MISNIPWFKGKKEGKKERKEGRHNEGEKEKEKKLYLPLSDNWGMKLWRIEEKEREQDGAKTKQSFHCLPQGAMSICLGLITGALGCGDNVQFQPCRWTPIPVRRGVQTDSSKGVDVLWSEPQRTELDIFAKLIVFFFFLDTLEKKLFGAVWKSFWVSPSQTLGDVS